MALLHLTTPADWRAALRTGGITPLEDFVHLSTAAQVTLPANRLFSGRADLLLLAIDPAGLDVRWEPGVPGDPESMRFPHAYGPIPTSAVLAGLPYRPRPDGGFDAPPPPPERADHAARLRALVDGLPRRVATAEVPVPGGLAARQDEAPWSHAVVDDATPAQDIAAGTADLGPVLVTVRGTDPGPVARELGRSGWRVHHEVAMVRAPVPGPSPAEQVDLGTVRPLWIALWRTDLPVDAPDRVRLVDQYGVFDGGADVRFLAVREAGRVVASAALLLDGATALLEAVATDPAAHGRGHGDALLRAASTIAAEAGCDLLGLHADADSWPRDWYARRGFAVVDERWTASRA
ncbi:GNAT family N-acetyltransferase [Pseudonocardia xishanensis]|uniref:N-acetyltransferase domain-containing protein n=1 Tax=Pseudonocardia xishanensis TaxID=630995 RepID=A0ABP8RK02_9PSEU